SGTSAGSRGSDGNADRTGRGSGSGDRGNPPVGAGDDDDGYVRLLPPQPKAPAGGTAVEAPPAHPARPGAEGAGAPPRPDSKEPGQEGRQPEEGAGAVIRDHDGQSPTVLAPAPPPDFPRLRSTPTPPREREASAE